MSRHALVNILLITSMGFLSCQSGAITHIEKEHTAKSKNGSNGYVRLKFNGKSGNNEETELGIGSHIRGIISH
jgi:hypothetical protein